MASLFISTSAYQAEALYRMSIDVLRGRFAFVHDKTTSTIHVVSIYQILPGTVY